MYLETFQTILKEIETDYKNLKFAWVFLDKRSQVLSWKSLCDVVSENIKFSTILWSFIGANS